MSLERLTPGTEGWERYHGDHLQRYHFFADQYKGKSVLDMACGTGYGSDIILAHGATNVVGVDVADEAISFARSHYKDPRLQFRQSDFRAVENKDTRFDLVISFETIEHVDNPSEFIKVVSNVLKPGGKAIISTPNKKKYSVAGINNPFHISELYYEEFKQIFSSHFSIGHEYHQTESVNYLRWQYAKLELDELKLGYERLPFNRLKRFAKRLVGKSKSTPAAPSVVLNAYPGDFVLEPMTAYNDSYSVIILEGTKR